MNFEAACNFIIDTLAGIKQSDPTVRFEKSQALIGQDGILDSMGLVELCVKIESFAEGQGFTFDWMSEFAMSNSRSIFRNIESLAHELVRQRDLAK